MNDCFFCGPTDNPLTEEHVWPRWVSRLLSGHYNSTHFVNVRSTGENTTGLWKSRQLDVTTDTVCDKCNNVWLSNFENKEIKPLATSLITGEDDAQIIFARPLDGSPSCVRCSARPSNHRMSA